MGKEGLGLRIALIYLGRRGSGGVLSLELGRHLQAHAQVTALISRQAENISQWHASGLPLMETDTYQGLAGAIWSWLNQPRLARLAAHIRRTIRPDVLLFPMFHTWTPFLQFYLRDIPNVLTVHDPLPHPGLFAWLDGQFQTLAIRQATRCIVLSGSLRPALEKRGVPAGRMDEIPHGELSYYKRVAGEGQGMKAASSRTILFFGRITEYKGIEVLLQAFERVQGDDIRLQIVGDGDFSPYRRLADQSNRVEVINRWVVEEEVASFFEAASLVVLPYTSASQSGVLALAASFGLPVIATRVGGLPEQITHEQTGLLVPPGDPAALAQAIQHLLDQPAYAAQLGQQLQLVQSRSHSWDQIALQTLVACQRAVADHEAHGMGEK